MERAQMRLELLKLTSHCPPGEAVARAKVFEAYVYEPDSEAPAVDGIQSTASLTDTPGSAGDADQRSAVGRPRKPRGNAGKLDDVLS